MKFSILAVVVLIPMNAFSWSQLNIDVTGQEFITDDSYILDHLVPLNAQSIVGSEKVLEKDIPPEFKSPFVLARFSDHPSFFSPVETVVWREKESKKYFVCVWGHPKISDEENKRKKIEITEELAELIYQLWVNALLETRYDKSGITCIDGSTYQFASFVRGLGPIGGQTCSPKDGYPPNWMVEAGNYLVELTINEDRDLKKAEFDFEGFLIRLSQYLEKHEKN